MQARKITIAVLIAALIVGPSLLSGVDLLTRHFCTASASGGFCGFLQGIAAALYHFGSVQALFLFFAPIIFALFLIASLAVKNTPEISGLINKTSLTDNYTRLSFGESRWLKIKLNSPNNIR